MDPLVIGSTAFGMGMAYIVLVGIPVEEAQAHVESFARAGVVVQWLVWAGIMGVFISAFYERTQSATLAGALCICGSIIGAMLGHVLFVAARYLNKVIARRAYREMRAKTDGERIES